MNATAANNYVITHIPFTTSVATDPIQNLVCNKTGKHLENDNGIVIICPPDAVRFTAQEANSTIGLNNLSSYQTLEYSTNAREWNSMTTTTTITFSNSGDSCYIRGVLGGNNADGNYTQFKMTGKIAASGNCNYLWNHENPDEPLKEYCGYKMFSGCTSLTTTPELPATTLTGGCYSNMFNRCSSLNYIKCLATNISARNCTAKWVSGVANTGTFVKAANMTGWTTGINGIPSDWTVEDAQ